MPQYQIYRPPTQNERKRTTAPLKLGGSERASSPAAAALQRATTYPDVYPVGAQIVAVLSTPNQHAGEAHSFIVEAFPPKPVRPTVRVVPAQ